MLPFQSILSAHRTFWEGPVSQAQSRAIALVVFGQFVPLVLFPWPLTLTSLIFVVLLVLLCVFLGWALSRRRAWGRTLTIFVQGFNIIIRLLTLFANVYKPAVGLNLALLIAYVASIGLSLAILNYIDRPEVQLIFAS
jgi:hypothetical protein